MVKIKRLVRNNLDYKTEKRREANRVRQKKVDSVRATLTPEDFKYIESEGLEDSDFNLIHKELDTNFDEEWMNCDTWLEQIIDNIDEYVDSPYYFSVIEPIVFGDVESSKDEENNKCCPTCWREVGAWYIPWVLCESWCFGLYDDSKDE